MLGKSLAHYEIQSKLGEGGMGEVYQASDTKLRRQVALKVLPPAFAQDPERMARFQREAQVLASLNHPHIAAIFGLEEDSGTHALVLELIEGPTLADRIRSGQLPREEIFRIALQMAQALETAHDSGVIHRDLKPENVKLTENGQVKVLDFGLAKAMDASAKDSVLDSPTMSPTLSPTLQPGITGAMTAANVILGTAGYMSPEQARGQEVDKRADIWAFGVVLFEMFTRQRLFLGDTVSDTLAAVLRLEPNFDDLPADTPAKMKRLLRRCLERDPDQRLRDIGDARIALQEMLAGDADPEPEPPAGGAGGGVKSSRVWMAAAASAAVAGVAGFFIATAMTPEPPEPPLLKFHIPVPDLSTTLSAGGTTAAISPDGKSIAYSSDNRLWIRDLDTLEPRALPETEGGQVPFWSPDGEWIGYGDANRLYKIRVRGGTPQTLCELATDFSPAAGGAWGPDGRIIFADGNGPLLSVPEQGGDPDTVLALNDDEQDFHNASALPDGRGVLFVSHRLPGNDFDRISVYADGERKLLVHMGDEQLNFPCWSPSGHILFGRERVNPGIWAVPFSLSRLEVTGEPFLAIPEAVLPSASHTGTLICAEGEVTDESQMGFFGRNGALRERVGELQNQAAYAPASPDGRLVVLRLVGEDSDLYVLDLERGTQSRLTFTDHGERWPAWSADGSRVYYEDNASDPSAIWLVQTDGSAEPVRVVEGGWPMTSPDGRFLHFIRLAETGFDSDMWYVPLAEDGLPSGEPTSFLDDDFVTFYGAASPDGRFIAYVSNSTGRYEIYLKRFPEGSGRWQVSTEGGFWPAWSSDGRTLYYVQGADLMSVAVETSPGVRLGSPDRLFTNEDPVRSMPFGWPDHFSLMPDGERFLFPIPGDIPGSEKPPGLLVVQNWYSQIDASK